MCSIVFTSKNITKIKSTIFHLNGNWCVYSMFCWLMFNIEWMYKSIVTKVSFTFCVCVWTTFRIFLMYCNVVQHMLMEIKVFVRQANIIIRFDFQQWLNTYICIFHMYYIVILNRFDDNCMAKALNITLL